MPDETPTESTADSTAETSPPASEEDVSSGGQSVEEVEAFWKNRVSLKDKGHVEAERVLREEIARLKAQPVTPAQNGDAVASSEMQKRIEELQRQVEEEHVQNLRMKYPALAEQVGDDVSLFKQTDEATLAKLNALGAKPAQPTPQPIMDHSTPKRTSASGQTPREPTTDELKGQLLKEEASWKEAQGY